MSELESNAGKGGAGGTAVADQNGVQLVGIPASAQNTDNAPASREDHQVVEISSDSRVVSSGGEDPLRKRLLEKDIEQGGEEEEENEALEEIDNTLWIKGIDLTHANRCKEALESWRKKDKLFTSRIDRKRKQSSDFQNEVYQLLGFYSVFQGVLLTAVAQSNLLHCNNVWAATLLSSLASFVCIIGVLLKLRKIKELEHTIADEEHTRRALVTWQLKLRESGQKFDFKDAKAPKDHKPTKTTWWLNASFLTIAVVLILFSVAFVVSIRQILCNPGHTLLP